MVFFDSHLVYHNERNFESFSFLSNKATTFHSFINGKSLVSRSIWCCYLFLPCSLIFSATDDDMRRTYGSCHFSSNLLLLLVKHSAVSSVSSLHGFCLRPIYFPSAYSITSKTKSNWVDCEIVSENTMQNARQRDRCRLSFIQRFSFDVD